MFSVAYAVVLSSLLIDALGVNILIELLIPYLVRRSCRKRKEQIVLILEHSSQVNELFVSNEEKVKFKDHLENADFKENFGFCFRYSFMIKTLFVSFTFSGAYPVLVLISLLHLIVQYAVDYVNLKVRYRKKPFIPFSTASVPVIRYVFTLLPFVKILSSLLVYQTNTRGKGVIVPLSIFLVISILFYIGNVAREAHVNFISRQKFTSSTEIDSFESSIENQNSHAYMIPSF
jgi:hypothetical protein